MRNRGSSAGLAAQKRPSRSGAACGSALMDELATPAQEAQRRFVRSLGDRVSLGSLWQLAKSPTLLVRLPQYLRQLYRYRTLEGPAARTRLRLYPCLGDAVAEQ